MVCYTVRHFKLQEILCLHLWSCISIFGLKFYNNYHKQRQLQSHRLRLQSFHRGFSLVSLYISQFSFPNSQFSIILYAITKCSFLWLGHPSGSYGTTSPQVEAFRTHPLRSVALLLYPLLPSKKALPFCSQACLPISLQKF